MLNVVLYLYSFNFWYHFNLIRISVDPEGIPGKLGVWWEYTLNGALRCTHSHTQSQCRVANPPISMFLGGGREST